MELIGIVGAAKITAAVISVLTGTAAGLYFSYRLKMREESLRELTRVLREMALLIRYRALPVRELFGELSRYAFIERVRGYGINGTDSESGDFRGDWLAAADSLIELRDGERAVVKSVGVSLGTSDIDGQLSMLELNAELLAKYGEEAREQYIKKGKLYRSCGILAGLFIAILIL